MLNELGNGTSASSRAGFRLGPVAGLIGLSMVALLAAALGGCGGGSSGGGSGGGGSSGEGGSGGGGGGSGDACAKDPPGAPFVFHIMNTGTRNLRLTYGCGRTLPIQVLAAQGSLSIGEGPADFCEISCDMVYAGTENNACSDCGIGVGASLNPGETVDIQWDRRVYMGIDADPKCTGHADGNHCALGVLVKSMMTTGTLTICADGEPVEGYCNSPDEEKVPFSLDLSANDLTIQVQ